MIKVVNLFCYAAGLKIFSNWCKATDAVSRCDKAVN